VAQVVAGLLRPAGRLFLREASPVLWAVDEERADDLHVQTDHAFTRTRSHVWTHGRGEIVTAVLEAGLELTQLVEHESVPWEPIPGQMVQGELGEWRLRERPERLPLTYTLQAVRRG
jgi:hypothetical protein